MKPEKSKFADRFRASDLAKIHIAKKQLGLDDDTYREMLHSVTGKKSAGDLTACQRKDVLEHLKMTGFLERRNGSSGSPYKGRPDAAMASGSSRGDQLKKIEALLTIGRLPWAYADGIAKRICKVDKLNWVKTRDLYKIITALRKRAQKEGWNLRE